MINRLFNIRTLNSVYYYIKLDVNTPEELAYIKGIFDNLYPVKADFTIMDVIRWLDAGELPDG
ncbi:MAG TPA: hypothetical protein ENI12_04620 [Nitrospirae bacterium]|nr:hypothetical protein [Nitrospirota bacterium]